jgi:hypothetical protein
MVSASVGSSDSVRIRGPRGRVPGIGYGDRIVGIEYDFKWPHDANQA